MQHKLSYYTLFSDEMEETSEVVAFSSRSAQMMVIHSDTYKLLLENRLNELPPHLQESLLRHHILVPKEENELETILTENNRFNEESTVFYYIIQPSANCQLGCSYCGQAHSKDTLQEDTEEKIIARIKDKLDASSKFETLSIAWFGGEPLLGLKSIRSLTPKLKKLAAEHRLAYMSKMATNGVSLKPEVYFELVNTLGLTHFEITLDGDQEFHDVRRNTKKGNQTFDVIVQNLLEIVHAKEYDPTKAAITIRCNVDKHNYLGIKPLLHTLKSNGLLEKISAFYLAPVHAWGNDAHLTSLPIEEFADFEISILLEQLRLGMPLDMVGTRKKQVCMIVDKEAELVDAFGNIFNCSEISYVPGLENSEYKLGNIKNDPTASFSEKPLSNWNDLIAEHTFPCHACKILPVCGGSCPKSWVDGIPPCPSEKFNMKDRLSLAYLMGQPDFTDMLHHE